MNRQVRNPRPAHRLLDAVAVFATLPICASVLGGCRSAKDPATSAAPATTAAQDPAAAAARRALIGTWSMNKPTRVGHNVNRYTFRPDGTAEFSMEPSSDPSLRSVTPGRYEVKGDQLTFLPDGDGMMSGPKVMTCRIDGGATLTLTGGNDLAWLVGTYTRTP